jgi:hypothetical protein
VSPAIPGVFDAVIVARHCAFLHFLRTLCGPEIDGSEVEESDAALAKLSEIAERHFVSIDLHAATESFDVERTGMVTRVV